MAGRGAQADTTVDPGLLQVFRQFDLDNSGYLDESTSLLKKQEEGRNEKKRKEKERKKNKPKKEASAGRKHPR